MSEIFIRLPHKNFLRIFRMRTSLNFFHRLKDTGGHIEVEWDCSLNWFETGIEESRKGKVVVIRTILSSSDNLIALCEEAH